MNEMTDIGLIVNKLRKEKKITLKELSDKSGLSTGFLSQFERGMTTIAVDSLIIIAKILEVDLDIFFHKKIASSGQEMLIRNYDREVSSVNSKYIQFNLVRNVTKVDFLPRIYEILPSKYGEKATENYVHEGQEFIYVIEGVLTIHIKNRTYEMYPEDSIYLDSHTPHNWENNTNKIVRILTVNSPNPYFSETADKISADLKNK
ncbi:helix-turn-helix domain-containing protein [Proteocatella sphenisci]|uniref:helix-turn-helix domain-containing protein n=1 Tax=Proteocatella sphenisci TaxID=181070 RepID=UPI000490F100|nr:cupin domain-containing protein [Proteocatella sphenisci]